jgi:hypothetical protein
MRTLTYQGKTALWGNDVSELYERNCYSFIFDYIVNKRAVLIRGTPGIVKTLFIFSFMCRVVSDASFVLRGRNGKEFFLSFVNGNATVVNRINQIGDYHVSDTNADSTAEAHKS